MVTNLTKAKGVEGKERKYVLLVQAVEKAFLENQTSERRVAFIELLKTLKEAKLAELVASTKKGYYAQWFLTFGRQKQRAKDKTYLEDLFKKYGV